MGAGRVWYEDEEEDEGRAGGEGGGVWTDWSVPALVWEGEGGKGGGEEEEEEEFSCLVSDAFELIGEQNRRRKGKRKEERAEEEEKGKGEKEKKKEKEPSTTNTTTTIAKHTPQHLNTLFQTIMTFLSSSFSLFIRHLTAPDHILRWISKMRSIISFETKKNFLRSSFVMTSHSNPIHIDRHAALEAGNLFI